MSEIKWACPKCGADVGLCGKGGPDACRNDAAKPKDCYGFVCECLDYGVKGTDTVTHGTSHAEPCHNAACHHCGWGGTFPPKPVKLTGWKKTAWAAGWRPTK